MNNDKIQAALDAVNDSCCFIAGNNTPTPEEAEQFRETIRTALTRSLKPSSEEVGRAIDAVAGYRDLLNEGTADFTELATAMGAVSETSETILSCLRNTPAKEKGEEVDDLKEKLQAIGTTLCHNAAELVRGFKHVSGCPDDVPKFMPKSTPKAVLAMIEREEDRVRSIGNNVAIAFHKLREITSQIKPAPVENSGPVDDKAGMLKPSPIYGEGWPTSEDYDECIQMLIDARSQLAPDGDGCHCCGDNGHQSFECHHNLLVMCRALIKRHQSHWVCFHCGAEFDDVAAAQEHFGETEKEKAKCLSADLVQPSSEGVKKSMAWIVDAIIGFMEIEQLSGRAALRRNGLPVGVLPGRNALFKKLENSELGKHIETVKAALSNSVQDGENSDVVRVPREPTEAMCRAGGEESEDGFEWLVTNIYKAMIADHEKESKA